MIMHPTIEVVIDRRLHVSTRVRVVLSQRGIACAGGEIHRCGKPLEKQVPIRCSVSHLFPELPVLRPFWEALHHVITGVTHLLQCRFQRHGAGPTEPCADNFQCHITLLQIIRSSQSIEYVPPCVGRLLGQRSHQANRKPGLYSAAERQAKNRRSLMRG